MKNCRYCSCPEVETDLGICKNCQEKVSVFVGAGGGIIGLEKYTWSKKYRPGLNADADRFDYFRRMEESGQMNNLKPAEKTDIEAWRKHLKKKLDL